MHSQNYIIFILVAIFALVLAEFLNFKRCTHYVEFLLLEVEQPVTRDPSIFMMNNFILEIKSLGLANKLTTEPFARLKFER